MRPPLILPILGLSFLFTISATAQKGYIILDSTYATGFIESQVRALNQSQVKFHRSLSMPTTTYGPNEVKEYGFGNKVFVSRKIPTDQGQTAYFLTLLSKGNTNLYTLKLNGKKRFFAESEKGFVELNKENKNYKNEIPAIFTSCTTYTRYLPYVKFNEKAFRRFFTMHNTCYEKGPWPFSRFGVVAGFSTTGLTIINAYGNELDMGKDTAPFAGVALELPIGTRATWFLNLQAVYQQNAFEKSVQELSQADLRYVDYEIKTSAITIPGSIKYCIPINKLKAFISAGPSVTYYLKNESLMVEDIHKPGETILNEDSSDLVKKMQLNAAAGFGLEYVLNGKSSVCIEGRYGKGKGLNSAGQSVSVKQITLVFYF